VDAIFFLRAVTNHCRDRKKEKKDERYDKSQQQQKEKRLERGIAAVDEIASSRLWRVSEINHVDIVGSFRLSRSRSVSRIASASDNNTPNVRCPPPPP
jgi:hypothetical protein